MEKPSANKLANPKIRTITEDREAPITPATTAKVVIEPAVANKRVLVALYKNGVGEKNVSDVHTASINPAGGGGSTIAYANGSTDYFEVYFYHNFGVATSDIDTAISSTFFQGHYLGSG